jgi:hypothetical protein
VVQPPNGAGNIVGKCLQFQLSQPGTVCFAARKGFSLNGKRLVKRCPDLIKSPAEIAAPSRLRSQLSDLLGQPIETATTVHPAAHQITERVAYCSR